MRVPLQERERVVVSTREHPQVLVAPIVAFLLLTSLCSFMLGYLSRDDLSDWLSDNAGIWQAVALLLWFVLSVIWSIAPWFRWLRSRIVLTTQRILFRSSYHGGPLQAVALASVRELAARSKGNGAMTRSGSLDLLLREGQLRIRHVPAVAYFRTLALETMGNLHSKQVPVDYNTRNSEGIGS